MPSEKSRYLNMNRGPSAPMNFGELVKHIHCFESKRLAKLLSISAERDDALRKALIVSISIQLAHGNWEKTKEVIDYALHFADYVPYTDCHYGIILYEIIETLEIIAKQVSKDFSMRVAQYIFERGQEISEIFEDDWDLCSTLDDLAVWINKNQAC